MTDPLHSDFDDPLDGRAPPRTGLVRAATAALVVAAITVTLVVVLRDDDDDSADDRETADITGQGGEGPDLAEGGAHLTRREDGVFVDVTAPVPRPGTYAYPTGDMVPPGSDPHPPVSQGASTAPEVFTLWVFAFNDPAACTDGACDTDDLAPEAPARGGVFQVDGRIAAGDSLTLGGNLRLGTAPAAGSALDNPFGAEIHVAIAPHGRYRPGADGTRQLNSPVGTPDFWWAAVFPPAAST